MTPDLVSNPVHFSIFTLTQYKLSYGQHEQIIGSTIKKKKEHQLHRGEKTKDFQKVNTAKKEFRLKKLMQIEIAKGSDCKYLIATCKCW